MNDIIKRVIGFDAYGYISKAIKNGDYNGLKKLDKEISKCCFLINENND